MPASARDHDNFAGSAPGDCPCIPERDALPPVVGQLAAAADPAAASQRAPTQMARRRVTRATVVRPPDHMAMATYLCSRYSAMPSWPPSRPKPDRLTPPNGAAALETIPWLRP